MDWPSIYRLAEATQQERRREAETRAQWRDLAAPTDRRPPVGTRLRRLIAECRGALVASRGRRTPREA
jgi:hypothetical protein